VIRKVPLPQQALQRRSGSTKRKTVIRKVPLPQQALPQQALPQQALPQQALPQQALPQQALPQQALQRRSGLADDENSTPAASVVFEKLVCTWCRMALSKTTSRGSFDHCVDTNSKCGRSSRTAWCHPEAYKVLFLADWIYASYVVDGGSAAARVPDINPMLIFVALTEPDVDYP
jgi:hypothetical protein